ncbi:SDR family NAD(P)-dependent oxidoreductase [Roseixanthobacter liquoris]|uniref:SDR family NAD(P)-dependent oxidoreductase n=1 Tax=Roseixanthobacter liquoris TaxID=3119921 RepID=UPI003729A9D4
MLEGKIAIVTGGASQRGIGWATASTFARNGARVAILDLRGSDAVAAAAAIGPAHRGYPCDVRDKDACRQVVEAVAAEFGGVDILVNNAGVSQPRTLLEIEEAGYDLVMDVSLRGAFNMARAVVPHLRARGGGAIVSIGSVSGQRGGGVMGGPHYSAAKGAVHALTKAMAREFAAEGIRVNAVAPGLIETDLIVGRLTDERRAMVVAATPMGRVGAPGEVADGCLFLASDLARYVTGVTLDINGGLHIH